MNKPVAEASLQTTGSWQNPSAAPTQAILIVEDDPITARYLELGLKRMGYSNLRSAGSSEAALDMVMQASVDLVLMDIQIEGGRDGIDTARVLRERFDVPVIFLTGLADAGTMERARDADPLGYLVKPVKAEDLRVALTAAFQKETLARTARERDCWLGGIVDTIGEPLVTCNAAGRVEFVNLQARQLLELQPGDPLQRPFGELLKLRTLEGKAITDPAELPAGEMLAVLSRATSELQIRLNVGRVADPRGRRLGMVVVLRTASDHATLEAELRRVRAELAAQSLTDELTGLYNRRGLNVLGDQQLKVVRRGRTAASVLLVAMQDMRDINERYGHDAGDNALRDLASVLRETFRESDLVGRIGGGEFAVLATTPDPSEAIVRLSANIAAHNAAAARAWQLSIKVGAITHYPKDVTRIPELLDAAGKALHTAGDQ